MKNPLISIIIAARNCETFIGPCIDSILNESSDNYEILVVDDASDDTTPKILKTYEKKGDITFLTLAGKRGAAEARNFGVSKSRGSFLFFLDADTCVRPGWVPIIEHINSANPKNSSIIICKLFQFKTNTIDSVGEYLSSLFILMDRGRGLIDNGQFEKEELVFSGKSAGMIVPRKIFTSIGGFDTRFEWLVEDTDLCWRAWLKGYTVRYMPQIVIDHHFITVGKDQEYYESLQARYRACRNTLLVVIKNVSAKSIWYILPLHIMLWLTISAVILIQGKWNNGKDILRGIFWNIITFRRTYQDRSQIQRERVLSDLELLMKVGIQKSFLEYVKKAINVLS